MSREQFDIVGPTDPGEPYKTVNWEAITASDNVGVAFFESTHQPGSPFPLGVTDVTYTARDAGGNETTTSFKVTVSDQEPPIITGVPLDLELGTDMGLPTAGVDWRLPEVSDNVGVVEIESTHQPGAAFPIGTTTVNYSARDAAGNETTASFVVSVRDNEAPAISGLPDGIVQAASAGMDTAIVSWNAPTVTDNVAVTNVEFDYVPGGKFPLGSTTVTYRAQDEAGNEAISSFSITVVDKELPRFSGVPADLALATDTGKATAIANWIAPTASDNVSVSSLVSSHQPGADFPVGATQVTYTATDEAGNEAVAAFTIVVTDGEAPVITGMPADIVVAADARVASTAVEWTPPTASDIVGVVSLSPSHAPGSVFFVGVTTVTYAARDAAGNEAFSTFTVTVEDRESPTITGVPAPIEQATDTGKTTATVSWREPVVTDNVEELITIIASHRPEDVFPLGVSTVSYTATDGAGNESSASFTVTVADEEAPVISGVPANLTLSTEVGKASAVATWVAPTADDNVSVAAFSGSHTTGTEFPIGETTVNYTATDEAGNSTTTSFLVTVIDDEKPVITGVPGDIVAVPDPGKSTAIITWEPPSASDNVAVTVLESSHVPGSPFTEGSTITVTYTAVDAAGNVATASFTVTVLKFAGVAGFRDWLTAKGDDPTIDLFADANQDSYANVFHYLFDVPLTTWFTSDPRELVSSVNPGLLSNRAAFVVKVPAVLPEGVIVVLEGTEDGYSWEALATRAAGEQDWQFSLPVLLQTSPPVGGLETVAVGLGKTYREAPVGLFRMRVVVDGE
ncbi:MAG: HYR domain-containing protein [Verrucomicrobiae bacterium]|nr:HYR domain-containing protein [Verrucomicrobiae bacterium]